MKTSTKINAIAIVCGLIYFLFSVIPLIKGILNNKKEYKAETTEWVEVPMIIEN